MNAIRSRDGLVEEFRRFLLRQWLGKCEETRGDNMFDYLVPGSIRRDCRLIGERERGKEGGGEKQQRAPYSGSTLSIVWMRTALCCADVRRNRYTNDLSIDNRCRLCNAGRVLTPSSYGTINIYFIHVHARIEINVFQRKQNGTGLDNSRYTTKTKKGY